MNRLPLHIVPDPDDPEFAVPFVDGTIDGRPYRFLFDTGARQSRVASDPYTEMLEVIGEKESGGLFAKVTDELVSLASLVLGPIEKRNLVVVRSPDEKRPSQIGMDVLGDKAIVVDFDSAELIFAEGAELKTQWPLRRSTGGQPFLDLDCGGQIAPACWDTGAGVTVVDVALVESNPGMFAPTGMNTGEDSTGATQDTPMYRMGAVTAGGITIAPHTVAAAPLPQGGTRMDIVLGYPALRQFIWTIDFPNNLWYATPLPQTA